MALHTNTSSLPPLPDYELKLMPDLVPGIPDKLLTLLLPIAAYWALSMLFHWIDVNDYFPQYRLHTPAEVLKRNHVSRWEVVRDVIIQQVIQTVVGWILGATEPDDFTGKEDYDVAVWGRRIRSAQSLVPSAMALVGLDAAGLSEKLAFTYPNLSGAVAGGIYPSLNTMVKNVGESEVLVSGFATWELQLGKAIYWAIIPVTQFLLAIFIIDTWQYFLHRAMHMNKWLYTTFHSRHHRLYVPYAFGALYNHPFEGFLLDTLGAGLAFKIAGMSTRQGMCLFTGSTFKTVDDHCGYSFPWDPLQHITSNNAGYHDVHHQSWGIKTNFSQPFFTFWDHFLGTVWAGGDVSARYQRDRIAAQKKVDADTTSTVTNSQTPSNHTAKPNPYENELQDATILRTMSRDDQQPLPPSGKAEQQAAGSREQVLEDPNVPGTQILREEAQEEKEAKSMVRKSNRRRTASSLTQSDSLRGLREKVNAHGRTGGILGMDRSQ